MTDTADAARAREYLLGTLDDHDRDHVEESYVSSASALETIEAAEESLIDDYLAGSLSGNDRHRFEQHYLSSPHHRTRVETIRRLGRAAARVPRRSQWGWLALAAGLVVAAGATLWMTRHSTPTRSVPASPSAAPAVASADSPAPFVFALAPVAVRGAGEADNPPLIVPPSARLVELHLQGDGTTPAVTRGRVLLRTVAGADVWQGPIVASAEKSSDTIAMVDLPATVLRPDDYAVVLFEIGASGGESERARYFLRVRAK